MSTAGPTSGEDEKRTEGVVGTFSRLKTVLRRGKSNRASTSSAAALATPTNAAEVDATPRQQRFGEAFYCFDIVADNLASSQAEHLPDVKPEIVSPEAGEDVVRVTKGVTRRPVMSNPERFEKARLLFAKYGLTIDEDEWISAPRAPVERVEKPIRMRVRRQCHRCQTMYGPDKICTSCQHTRCKKCPRFPPKKPKTNPTGEARGAVTMGPPPPPAAAASLPVLDVDPMYRQSSKYVLSRPSTTGGQDMLRKPPVQRVRRTCHRCFTLFNPQSASECENCKHVRCKKCPRDPPKLRKYPDGYPGDAETETETNRREWKRPRRRVRWTCHSCQSMFKEGEKTCHQCSHERCDGCSREP